MSSTDAIHHYDLWQIHQIDDLPYWFGAADTDHLIERLLTVLAEENGIERGQITARLVAEHNGSGFIEIHCAGGGGRITTFIFRRSC